MTTNINVSIYHHANPFFKGQLLDKGKYWYNNTRDGD